MGSNFNPFNPTAFNQSTFGTQGNPGFLSPFDIGVNTNALTTSTDELTQQYKDMGLGQNPATPAGPNQTFKGGGGGSAGGGGASGSWTPGSGTTPTNPGSFGGGSLPYQQDTGGAPSVTGGLPALFQANLGNIQNQDLGATTTSALAALEGKNAQTKLIGGGLGALGKII